MLNLKGQCLEERNVGCTSFAVEAELNGSPDLLSRSCMDRVCSGRVRS